MNESQNSNDERMVQKIGAMLEQSANALEPAHADTLRRARQRAVAQAGTGATRAGRWLPVAAAAGVAALAAAVTLLLPSADRSANELVADAEGSDIDILLGDESLDMIADLEFYEWLSAEAEAGADAG